MSYNPFESMRKNSKAVMAGLAIVCMLVFVLSSGLGGGDFFDWLARIFSSESRMAKNEVATFYGEKITRAELSTTSRNRVIANQFMFSAVVAAHDARMKQIEIDLTQGNRYTDADAKKALQEFFAARKRLSESTSLRKNEADSLIFTYESAIEGLRDARKNLAATKPEREAIDKIIAINQQQRELYQDASGGKDSALYFKYPPNVTTKDTLDFIMLLRKADKMGMKFTDEHIRLLIARETDNQLTAKKADEIMVMLQERFTGLSADDVLAAVGDEFRVRAVINALSGSGSDALAATADALTPLEFFEYYKDRCSELTFTMIEVPVEPFIADVKDTPTEDELRRLFTRYALKDFSPALPEPGFKEPRKILGEYIAFEPKSKYYENNLKVIAAVSTIGAGMIPLIPGTGAVESAVHITQPYMAEHLPLEEQIRDRVERAQGFPMASEFTALRFRDSTFYHPGPFAALAAQLVGPASIGNLLGASADWYNLMYSIEARDRVKQGMPYFLSAYGWGGLPDTLVPRYPLMAIAPLAASTPPAPPVALYRAEMQERNRIQKIRELCQKDRQYFIRKLDEIGQKIVLLKPNAPDTDENKEKAKKNEEARKEAQAFITQFAKDRNYIVTRLDKPIDQLGAKDAPETQKLREIVDEMRRNFVLHTQMAANLPRWFNEINGFFEEPLLKPESTLYRPERFPNYLPASMLRMQQQQLLMQGIQINSAIEGTSDKLYVIWRVEDYPAKEYKRWDEVPPEMRERVLKAWKTPRARELARKEAEAIAKELRALAEAELRTADNPAAFDKGLNDLMAKFDEKQKSIRSFELRGIAKLKARKDPGLEGTYSPFPEIREQDIEYPTLEMIKTLQDQRNKPIGEVIVLEDQPKSHYYVACLLRKNEKTLPEFNSMVYRRTVVKDDETKRDPRQRVIRDQLYSLAQREFVTKDYFKDVMDRVRAEGNFTINPEEEKQLNARQE